MSNSEKTLGAKGSHVYYHLGNEVLCFSYHLRNLLEEWFLFCGFVFFFSWLSMTDGICFTCGCYCVMFPAEGAGRRLPFPWWAMNGTASLAECLEDSKEFVHCWDEQGAHREQGLAGVVKTGCWRSQSSVSADLHRQRTGGQHWCACR